MSMREFVDGNGFGMLVVGDFVDVTFREEADKAKRPDERLLDTTPEAALDPELTRAVALDCCAALATHKTVEVEAA